MYIIAPGSHPEADAFWKKQLHSKPNGARVLGGAIVKHLSDLFEPHYDMLVAYASEFSFDIPKDVKKIAVMWHCNYPWLAGIASWRRVQARLLDYDVDYYCNEQKIVDLIRESGGRAFLLPRFVDTDTLPVPSKDKHNGTLWYGNRWSEFATEFKQYCDSVRVPCWISQGKFGVGIEEKSDIDRAVALEILNDSRQVFAIGVSQLEAMYLGCTVHPYRGERLPYYDQHTIRVVARQIIEEANLF